MKLWLLLFISFVVLFESAVAVWWRLVSEKKRGRLLGAIRAGLTPVEGVARPVVLVEPLPPKPGLMERLFKPGGDDMGWTSRQWTIRTVLGAFLGFAVGSLSVGMIGLAGPIMGMAAGSYVPRMIQKKRRKKRLATLEEQFPDALDCLARSVRAGNAFSVAIELLASEVNEPLKSEVRKITREMTLGARLEDALSGFMMRVPLVEVRFFVSAVLLQRETGGNLAEVISKLASSIRERFKLRGQVKAASGQGRITAAVLTVLPVATLIILKLVSPDYLASLTNDPLGRNMLAGAVVLQVTGYLIMKRIINIEV